MSGIRACLNLSIYKTFIKSVPESADKNLNQDNEVVFSEKVCYLTFGDYPALSASPVQELVFAPDQEGILLTVHGPGVFTITMCDKTKK